MWSTSRFLLLSGAAILILSHLAASLHNEEDTSDGIVASRDDPIVPKSRGKGGPGGYRCRKNGGRCTAEDLCKTLTMKEKCDEIDGIKYMCCAKNKNKGCTDNQNRLCKKEGGFYVMKKKACALGQILKNYKCETRKNKGRKKRHCCVPTPTTTPKTTEAPTTPTTTPTTTETPTSCVNGIFTVGLENFCFLNDSQRSWNDSKDECETMGMILAEPTDPKAVVLDIIDNHDLGYGLTWVGARTTGIAGTTFTWQRSGSVISNTSPLWYGGDPGLSGRVKTNACVCMLNAHPSEVMGDAPLWSDECDSSYWTLCQVV